MRLPPQRNHTVMPTGGTVFFSVQPPLYLRFSFALYPTACSAILALRVQPLYADIIRHGGASCFSRDFVKVLYVRQSMKSSPVCTGFQLNEKLKANENESETLLTKSLF